MDPADDDARFFVEEVLDDDASASVPEGTVEDSLDQDAGDGEARYDGILVQGRSNTSMSTHDCLRTRYNAAAANGSSMMSVGRRMGMTTTSTTINNDNSHNRVNITNIYHQKQAFVEDEEEEEEEEDTRRPGSQPQEVVVETIWGEVKATSTSTSTTANHHQHHHYHDDQQQNLSLQLWWTFPTWAIRLTFWILKGLQAPIIWVFRSCLGLVFQGVAGIILLLIISLVGLWALKWWWLQVWSLPYTAAAAAAAASSSSSPLSTAYTSIWLWLGYAIENPQHPFSQATSSSSSPPSFSSPSDSYCSSIPANTVQTNAHSATKTLSSVALTVSSAVLWGDGYMRVAGSIVSQCDLQGASIFTGPLATARSELPRVEEMHRSTVAFKDRINTQLAREAQRARRLERKVRQTSLQTMLKNQKAEAREAYNTHVAPLREHYCSGLETSSSSLSAWLRHLLCWAWQRLWPPTPVESGSTTSLNKPKMHYILESWLEEGLCYMEDVLQARLEWESVYKGMVNDRATQRLGRVWCQISQASTKQRQRDWQEGVSGQQKDGNGDKGLGVQLADIESTSQLACLAHGPMGNDLQQRLSKLKDNTQWLEDRIQEIRLGPLASLQDRSGVTDKDNVGNEADYLSHVLFAADDLQAIRDFITDSLILQEQFNTETFTGKTAEMVL